MAGRRPKYQEFLHTLKEIVELEGGAFAKAIGKKYTNVSQYLSGSKDVGPRTLRSAVYHLGEWDVKALFEVDPKPNLNEIPQTPGIYALYDSSASIIYVGQATRLRAEISQTLNRKTNFPVRSVLRSRRSIIPNTKKSLPELARTRFHRLGFGITWKLSSFECFRIRAITTSWGSSNEFAF